MLTLQGEKNKLTSLAFSPDGSLLAAPVWKRGVQIWRMPFARKKSVLIPDKPGATGVTFAADGRLFVEGNHTYLLQYDLGSGVATTIEAIPGQGGYAYYWGISPDGRHLVATHWGKTAGKSYYFCRHLSAPDQDVWRQPTKRVTFGTPLFVGDAVVTFEMDRKGTVCVLRDLVTGKIRSNWPHLVRQAGGPVSSPDGTLWAVRQERSVWVFSATDFGKSVASVLGSAKTHITGHTFHPSGRYLLVSSVDQSVRVYDTTTWQLVRTYDSGLGKLFSVAVSPDGTWIAAGGAKGQIAIWKWK